MHRLQLLYVQAGWYVRRVQEGWYVYVYVPVEFYTKDYAQKP